MPTLVTPLGGNSLHFTQLPLETKIGFIPDFFFFPFMPHMLAEHHSLPRYMGKTCPLYPPVSLPSVQNAAAVNFPSSFAIEIPVSDGKMLAARCRRDILSMCSNEKEGRKWTGRAIVAVCDATKGWFPDTLRKSGADRRRKWKRQTFLVSLKFTNWLKGKL